MAHATSPRRTRAVLDVLKSLCGRAADDEGTVREGLVGNPPGVIIAHVRERVQQAGQHMRFVREPRHRCLNRLHGSRISPGCQRDHHTNDDVRIGMRQGPQQLVAKVAFVKLDNISATVRATAVGV